MLADARHSFDLASASGADYDSVAEDIRAGPESEQDLRGGNSHAVHGRCRAQLHTIN